MSVPMGIGAQVNKFEQVSSDDHELSVVGEGDWTGRGGGGRERGGDGEGKGREREGVRSPRPCDLSHTAYDVHTHSPPSRMTERHQ